MYEIERSRRRRHDWRWTARRLMALVGLVGIVASGVFWFPIQHALTDDLIVSGVMTILLALMPAACWAFLVPSTPAGMLLQRYNAQTWGFLATGAIAVFLLAYEVHLMNAWWLAQPVAADSGMVPWQIGVLLIAFIFLPALCLPAVTSDEMLEQIRQHRIVQKYKLETEAEIAILRSQLLESQRKAAVGIARLTMEEREELAGVMRGLLAGIDGTMEDLAASVHRLTGTHLELDYLEDSSEIADILSFVERSLVEDVVPKPRRRGDTAMRAVLAAQPTGAAPASDRRAA